MDQLAPQCLSFLNSLPDPHHAMIVGTQARVLWEEDECRIVLATTDPKKRAAIGSLFSLEPCHAAYRWMLL